MKKRWSIGFFFLLTILLHNCQLLDSNSREVELAAILKNPPIAALTDSLSRFPKDAGLYLRRGELLSQKNHHDLAYADYKKAWELRPDEANGLAYTSNLFISGKVPEAINILRHCAQEFPANTEFSRRLSEAYVQNGQTKEALEQYNTLLATDSSNFEAWYEKGILLADQKDTAQAIRALEMAYSLQPLHMFGISLANLYAETKDAKAIRVCDELIEKRTTQDDAEAVFVKGVYYSNAGQQEKALEQFELCIKQDWKFTEAYMEKGIILFNQKNIDEALKTFALAAKVSNTYADAYYWMARCLEAIGKTDEARNNYERAIALDRHFTEAKQALKRLKE